MAVMTIGPFIQSYGPVVSIGAFLTFYVVFAPLEYIPTISKRLPFFGSSFVFKVLKYLFGPFHVKIN